MTRFQGEGQGEEGDQGPVGGERTGGRTGGRDSAALGGDKAEHRTRRILWKDSGAWSWTQPGLHGVTRQGPGQPWQLHCQFRAQRGALGCEHSPDAHKGAATQGWGSSRMRPLLSQGKSWPWVHTRHPTGSASSRPRCVTHVCPLLGYAQNNCHGRSREWGVRPWWGHGHRVWAACQSPSCSPTLGPHVCHIHGT